MQTVLCQNQVGAVQIERRQDASDGRAQSRLTVETNGLTLSHTITRTLAKRLHSGHKQILLQNSLSLKLVASYQKGRDSLK